MPEGFSTLADLQILVDARTEGLQKGLEGASKLVHRFAADGTDNLKGFDKVVSGIGGGVEAARGKLAVLAQALQLVSANLQAVKAVGGQAAAAIGASEDFDRVLGGLSDLGDAIAEGLGGAWDRAASSATGYFAVADASGGSGGPGVGVTKQAADTAVDALAQVSHAFRRLAEEGKWSGKTIEAEFGLVEDQLNKFAAEAKRIAAEGSVLDGMLGTDSMGANLEQVGALLARVQELNELRRASAGRNSAAERDQADALGAAEFDKLIPALEREITALERKAAALGLTKGEAAAYATVMQVIDGLTKSGATLTEDAALKLGDYAARVRELTEATESLAKVQATTKFMDGLDREVRTLDQQAATLGKSTAEVAALNAEMRIRNQITDQGLELSAEERAKVEATIGAIRQRTLAYNADKTARDNADRADKGFEQTLVKLQRETMLLREKAAALGDSSDAGQIQARVDRELADLASRGMPIAEKRVASLRAEVTAQIEAKRALEDFQRQMQAVQESGQIVSRSLESAFSAWTEGSKISVRDMARSMLADLAQLTFQRGVIDTLFGGGGSSGGGLLGNFAASVVGGLFGGAGGGGGGWAATVTPAFADGGRPPLDRPSLIGERGPEMFWPDGAGTVISNEAIRAAMTGARSGGGVSISMPIHINAQGAYPESIADIRREIAGAQASLPGRVVQVVREAQERGVA